MEPLKLNNFVGLDLHSPIINDGFLLLSLYIMITLQIMRLTRQGALGLTCITTLRFVNGGSLDSALIFLHAFLTFITLVRSAPV